MTRSRTSSPHCSSWRRGVVAGLLLVAAVVGSWVWWGAPDRPPLLTLVGRVEMPVEDGSFEPVTFRFSPRADRLAIIPSMGEPEETRIRLWDVAKAKVQPSPIAHTGLDLVDSWAFSPDGGRMACVDRHSEGRADWDDRVSVWDLEDGSRLLFDALCPLSVEDVGMPTVQFTDEGRRLVVTFCSDAEEPDEDDPSPSPSVLRVAESWLVSWDLATRQRTELREPYDPKFARPSFSPDGRIKAVSGVRGLRLVEVASGRTFREIPCDAARRKSTVLRCMPSQRLENLELSFSEDGSLLWMVGDYDPAATPVALNVGWTGLRGLWRVADGRPLPIPPAMPIRLFRPEGPGVLVGIADVRGQGWLAAGQRFVDVGSGERLGWLSLPGSVEDFGVSPDGRLAAVAWERQVPHWSSLLPPSLAERLGIARREELVVGISVVEVRTGRVVGRIELPERTFSLGPPSLRFSPDGRTLVTAEGDHGVQLWNAP